MYNEKRTNPLLVLIPLLLIIAGIFLVVFDFNKLVPENNNNQTEGIINNQITNTVVDYNEITVEDLDQAVQVAADKVSQAVIGVTSKAITKVGTKVVEVNYSIGSGVIYKREEIKNGSGQVVNYRYYVITNRHVVTLDSSHTEYSGINLYIYLQLR